MNWLHATMPIAGIRIFWPGLVILGFGVGIIGSFFGMGGAWMVTPGLNILGFPMAFAIGTDITHTAGNSLVSAMRRFRFGKVDYKLTLSTIVGTVLGLETGAQIMMWLERLGVINLYFRWTYVALLTFMAWLVLADLPKRPHERGREVASGRQSYKVPSRVQWQMSLLNANIPPMVTFKAAGIRCSLWLPVGFSYMAGILAGLIGLVGGDLRIPALIYLGCPTPIAIGTNSFEAAISGLYGAATYSYKGRAELGAVLIMVIATTIGARIGSAATRYVKGYPIRIFFGLAVIGCDLSVILKILSASYSNIRTPTDTIATALILCVVSATSLYILVAFLWGVASERSERRARVAVGKGN